jgi:hypothetical protein
VKEPLIIDMAPALAPQSQRSKPRFVRAQGASLILLLAVLIFGPLAFGATEPWSQFLQRTATIALFLLWVVWQHFEDSVQFFPSAGYRWHGISLRHLVGITQPDDLRHHGSARGRVVPAQKDSTYICHHDGNLRSLSLHHLGSSGSVRNLQHLLATQSRRALRLHLRSVR